MTARNKGGTDLFKKQMAALEKVKSTLPTIIANTAENFFKASFRKQGWDDQSVKRWRGRKGQIHGGIAMVPSKSKGSRAILIKSGALRRSIHTTTATWKRIVITSDMPYSAIHNNGGAINKGGHKINMPQRKFMGNSYNLRKKITQDMERELNKVFK